MENLGAAMINKPASRRPRSIGMRDAKWMITALSITATLGLWNLFTRQSITGTAPIVAGNTTPSRDVKIAVLEFPPLPTLVPQMASSGATISAGVGAQAGLPGNISQAPAQQPAKIFMGGARPQSRQAGPVATTRSSR